MDRRSDAGSVPSLPPAPFVAETLSSPRTCVDREPVATDQNDPQKATELDGVRPQEPDGGNDLLALLWEHDEPKAAKAATVISLTARRRAGR